MSKKNDESLSNRLKQARTIAGIFQKDLADKVGVTQHQISLYESGASKPRLSTLEKLANALNISTEWLLTGNGKGITNLGHTNQILATKVPLINPENVLAFINSEDCQILEYIASTSNLSDKSFAIKIFGDSMFASHGNISIPNDSIVIFDCFDKYHSNDIVFVILIDGTVTVKQLIRDAGISYLKSLNNNYKPIPINEDEIIILGKAMQVIINIS